MQHSYLIIQACAYLLAIIITVPIAKRLGLSSVLGYLIAGVLIGPYVLGVINNSNPALIHVGELGIVMLLFVIGLELRPGLLWSMRRSIFGVGILQVIFTTIVICLISVLLKIDLKMAIAIGMILSLSSTAIVLQTMGEKGWLNTAAGKCSFAVLLFQDIAVIPMFALLPLLASKNFTSITPVDHYQIITTTNWQKALLSAAVIAAIIIIGLFVIRPLLRFIAQSKASEMFTPVSLFIVIATVLAMQAVDLSPALGAFLAGVILAESEYRHELEANIEPFKSLLLGLFFITVGSNLNFKIILAQPWLILGLVCALVIVKFSVLWILGKVFKLPKRDNLLFSFALLQGGEFCFVLFSYSTQNNILPAKIVDPLVVVVALSMLVTPLFILLYEKVFEPKFINEQTDRSQDTITHADNEVIIAGFGRYGQIVGRLLMANGIKTTILDLDPSHVDLVRRFGYKVFYGDAVRIELLQAAKVEQAKLFILAIDDSEKALAIAQTVRRYYPKLKILIRVRGRTQAYEFIKLGFNAVYRETFDSSLKMGVEALQILGYSAAEAERLAALFKHHDEETLQKLAPYYGNDEQVYISEVLKSKQNLEQVFDNDNRQANKIAANQ